MAKLTIRRGSHLYGPLVEYQRNDLNELPSPSAPKFVLRADGTILVNYGGGWKEHGKLRDRTPDGIRAAYERRKREHVVLRDHGLSLRLR